MLVGSAFSVLPLHHTPRLPWPRRDSNPGLLIQSQVTEPRSALASCTVTVSIRVLPLIERRH